MTKQQKENGSNSLVLVSNKDPHLWIKRWRCFWCQQRCSVMY